MNRKLSFLDLITLVSFFVGIYALDLTIQNLRENEDQTGSLKDILIYLENHLETQDEHLEKQDEILKTITEKGSGRVD